MTVAELGDLQGLLNEVIGETGIDTDEPKIEFLVQQGKINSDLTIGVDVTKTSHLIANEGICHDGVKLHGKGFQVTPAQAQHLGLGRRPNLEQYIRPYRNGRDIAQLSRGLMVIDLFGLEIDEVRKRYPEVYQQVLATVKPDRDLNNRGSYRALWWIFGEPRREMRPALAGLHRYIATVDTARHRVFQFLPADVICDDKAVIVATDDAWLLGALQSSIHVTWALRAGGWLGVGNDPVYVKTKVFDPFPFPSPGEILKSKLRTVAEELDAFRKQRQKEHPDLTLTQMYNVLEKLKSNTPLDQDDEAIKDKGLILILKELHERLDALVFEAYSWPRTTTNEQFLERLVALNHERAEEERRSHVRWLRPDYQIPRFGQKLDKQAAKEEGAQIAADLGLPEVSARKPSFPADQVAQTAAVFAALGAARGLTSAEALASNFRKTKGLEKSIHGVLSSLVRLGYVTTKDGENFELRRVA